MNNYEKSVKNHQLGATINLFVTPEAKTVIFPAGYNNWRRCIEMKVTSPAKENKANKEVIKTVADFFDKPVTEVFVVSGDKNRKKTVLVKDISADIISERLEESLNGL
jgi:uncharacterized protein (TIGR00251 family)